MLIGLRASGKSTVGRLVASRLHREFIDLDDLTAAELDARHAGEALAAHGEPRFREAEARALASVLSGSGLEPRLPAPVLALGGGTPTGHAARVLIEQVRAAGGFVTIYLDTPSSVLKSRLATDATPRPTLTGRGTIEEAEQLRAVRDPIYRALADHVISAGAESPEAIADRIVRLLT